MKQLAADSRGSVVGGNRQPQVRPVLMGPVVSLGICNLEP